MTKYIVMKVNVYEMKAHLSSYLARVEAGETVTLCRRNVAVAELRPLPPERAETPRPLGLARDKYGTWTLPDSFNDPMPDDWMESFEGPGL